MPIDRQILQRLQINVSELTMLDLSSQKLTAIDMQELARVLQDNTSLKSLNVSDNQIRDEGAKALAQNQTLTSLNVSRNQIKDEGAKALAQNQTLTSLDIYSNSIGAEGAKALARNQTLTSLSVYGNHIGTEGAKALSQNTTLTSLNVAGNQIGVEGAKALAQNQTLTFLSVYGNQIGDEGAKALAQNQTLTSLSVYGNQIGDKGAKALSQNMTLTSLNVGSNQIGDEGAKALAQNQILTSLDVMNNLIRDDGANALAQNQTLTSLHIYGNQIGNEADQCIQSMLQTNQRRVIERRNQFIRHLLWTKAQLLPLELVAHIISYVDSITFLSLVNLKHFAHMGKSENQAYQCASFILHNARAVKNQLALAVTSEPLIIEHKPNAREKLSAQHFSLFKAKDEPQAHQSVTEHAAISVTDTSQLLPMATMASSNGVWQAANPFSSFPAWLFFQPLPIEPKLDRTAYMQFMQAEERRMLALLKPKL